MLVQLYSISYGIGGVLMQEHDDQLHPVAFRSRTLTEAEVRYAQIDKETSSRSMDMQETITLPFGASNFQAPDWSETFSTID